MSEIYCRKCGNIVQPSDLFCRKCGSSLTVETNRVESAETSNLIQVRNKNLAMYHVICPQCSKENIGSSLECENCSTSLVGKKRTQSSEKSLAETVTSNFAYDFSVDENNPRDMIVPLTHCSSCFAVLPTFTDRAVHDLYVLAKFPTGYSASASPTNFSTFVKLSSGITEYQGNYRRLHTKSFDFHFPLCKNCFYDYRILKGYEPTLYDPTYKEDPKLKRVALIFYIIAGLAFSTLFLFFLTNTYPALTEYLMIVFFSSFLLFPIGSIFASLAKSYDKKLKKGLESDAKIRYKAVSGIGLDGEIIITGKAGLIKSAPFIRKYRFQLNFKNEQYRDLFASLNKEGSS